jgi:hypothetical protein
VFVVHIGERLSFREIFTIEFSGYNSRTPWYQKLLSYRYDLIPRGWMYQNIKYAAALEQPLLDSFDPANEQVFPKKFDEANAQLMKSLDHWSIFQFLAALAIPNFTKAMQTCAYNQTLAHQAQIACALERCRLANGKYPESLAALSPQFIEKISQDIIGGQPMHYRRADDGTFLLYSVGWNETDDGGIVVNDKSGNVDKTKGDWIWKN